MVSMTPANSSEVLLKGDNRCMKTPCARYHAAPY